MAVKTGIPRGARLAQSLEHLILDLGVVNLSPTLGVEIIKKIHKIKFATHSVVKPLPLSTAGTFYQPKQKLYNPLAGTLLLFPLLSSWQPLIYLLSL